MKFGGQNKSILARIFLTAAIMIASAMINFVPAWALTGSGADDDPYMVTTGEELDEAIRSVQNHPDDMVYIELGNDIDAITSATYQVTGDAMRHITIDGATHAINGNDRDGTSLRFDSSKAAGGSVVQEVVLTNLIMKNLKTPIVGTNGYNYGGGAIAMRAGNLKIDKCTFINNENTVDGRGGNGLPSSGGGAVFVQSGFSSLTITDSTFYGNKSVQPGGAIILSPGTGIIASGIIKNSTIVGNEVVSSAGYTGGGVYKSTFDGVSLKIKNSIVAGNKIYTNGTMTLNDIGSSLLDGGYNLIGVWPGGGSQQIGTNTSNKNVEDIVVSGPPKVNRRGTPTIALLDDSCAVGAADSSTATKYDQRGFARNESAPCIGAFEYIAPDDNLSPDDGNSSNAGTGGSSGCNSGLTGLALSICAFIKVIKRRKGW